MKNPNLDTKFVLWRSELQDINGSNIIWKFEQNPLKNGGVIEFRRFSNFQKEALSSVFLLPTRNSKIVGTLLSMSISHNLLKVQRT